MHFRWPLVLVFAAVVAGEDGTPRQPQQPSAPTQPAAPTQTAAATTSGTWKIVGWNDLGMHCMDGKDYSVYSILPPYNNVNAQIISGGKLVKSATGLKVTYEAVADPTGSINRTSVGQDQLLAVRAGFVWRNLPGDAGLAGSNMPGAGNAPQPLKFDPSTNWFRAEGIPISPYDDAGKKNYYPMMKLSVRNSSGSLLASTNVVLPVSDEIDCSSCHKSGAPTAARPASGWSYLADPERDYKMNVLRIHDDRQAGSPVYTNALQKAGYSPAGLAATVNVNKTPILCARCHLSNALKIGMAGISPLTTAIHKHHALVTDPSNGLLLDSYLQSVGLLPLPSWLHDQVPARGHGQCDRT